MRKSHSGKKHSLRHYRDNLDQLDREDYCCLVFTTLFNGHYLPWLKQCYTNTVPSNPNPTTGVSTISGSNPSTYQQQFIDRQVTMTSGLELAFPVTYPRRSKLINELALERCFNLKRKLMLTIDDVAICREQLETDDNAAAADDDNGGGGGGALSEPQPKLNVDRALQVRFLVVDTKTDSDCYQLYNCKTVIKIKENFSIYLELPLLMNNTSTKVFIEFLLIEDPSAAPTDNSQQQQPHSGIKEVYNENDNILYTVKECEISGYSGNCKELSVPIVDQDPSKGQLNFRLNLRWELDTNSLMAEVTRPEVVIKYYSGVLLALGTYFWRFYSSLYILMLQHEQTQVEAIKSLNEISFLIGYSNKSKLFSVVLDILANNVVRPLPEPESKQNLASNTTGTTSPVCDDQCRIFFRVLNISLLWLDTSNTDEQCHVLELFYLDPFRHLLRFQCPRMLRREMIELYRLFLRRLTKILERKRKQYQQSRQYQQQIEAGANAKTSGAIIAIQALERFIGQINLYLEHILNIMIDVTKCSEEILTARKRSQSSDPGDENGIGEVDGAQVQSQPQPQQEQSLQSRADENDLTSLKLIQTDTIQLFVKYIQTKVQTVKRLKTLKQTKIRTRNDSTDNAKNGEKEDTRGHKEQVDAHYLDENEDEDYDDDSGKESENESDQDEGSEYESDDEVNQSYDDENTQVSSTNSSYATTTTSTTSNTGSTVGSSLYETDDYDNPNRNNNRANNKLNRHNNNQQTNEDKPNNKAKIADSGYEILAQNSSNYGNRTTAIGSNFGVNSTVEQLMTNFVNCDAQAEAGTESQLPPQSTPPLVDGATDPPPPLPQQQQQQPESEPPASEVQQPKSKTASIKIRKGASCSSSRFEIDNFQKILSSDLCEKFQSENMFTSEFHRPAARLIRKIAKQFYRHNLIKDKKVDVVFNRTV